MSVIFNTKKPRISGGEWLRYIQRVDDNLHSEYDNRDIIILSAPTKPARIRSILDGYMMDNDLEQSLFCSDIILDFLNLNIQCIRRRLPNDGDSKSLSQSLFWMLSPYAVVILHIQSGDMFTLPRRPSSEFNLQFMPFRNYSDVIERHIFKELDVSFPSTFDMMPQDWTKKEDFSRIPEVGYLCDDGTTVTTDVVRQKKDGSQIFVHFKHCASRGGSKYRWISVPNDRISPPRLERTGKGGRSASFVPIRAASSNEPVFAISITPNPNPVNGQMTQRSLVWRAVSNMDMGDIMRSMSRISIIS